MRCIALALITTASLSVGLAPNAFAADMPVKVRPAPPAAAYSWTGCYIGVHAGGLWGQTRWSGFSSPPAFEPNQIVDYSSVTAGAQAGCNYQTGQFVFGIEVDASWADVDKFGFTDQIDRDDIIRTKIDWYGSVRGRLGIAWDRALLYATGGWAYANTKLSFENYTDASLTELLQSSRLRVGSGWVVGGGIEWALTPHWSAKAEYLHYRFDKKLVHDLVGVSDTIFGQPSFHVARVGLNYRFGQPRRSSQGIDGGLA